MAVVEGAYDPLPAPPVVQTGALVSFDGQAVDPDGAYLFDNSVVTMSGYQNAFPNYVVGWPDTVYANYEGINAAYTDTAPPSQVGAHTGPHADQPHIAGVPHSFIA